MTERAVDRAPGPSVTASKSRAWSNPVRAAVALTAFLLMNAGMVAVWPAAYFSSRDEATLIRRCAAWTGWWLRQCRRLMGIRVVVNGPVPPPGSLIASNHMGYADIFAIGGSAPCFFVAKSEVKSWPVIGYVFHLSRQIAISRARSTKSLLETNRIIADRLRMGYSVCVFLEGTSSGGESVLPFHGSLLQPAINVDARIVPAAIRWRSTNPAVNIAEDVAYWKDHRFGPHLFRLLGLSGLEAEIRFGAPLSHDGRTRQELARTLHEEVAALHRSLPGDAPGKED